MVPLHQLVVVVAAAVEAVATVAGVDVAASATIWLVKELSCASVDVLAADWYCAACAEVMTPSATAFDNAAENALRSACVGAVL